MSDFTKDGWAEQLAIFRRTINANDTP